MGCGREKHRARGGRRIKGWTGWDGRESKGNVMPALFQQWGQEDWKVSCVKSQCDWQMYFEVEGYACMFTERVANESCRTPTQILHCQHDCRERCSNLAEREFLFCCFFSHLLFIISICDYVLLTVSNFPPSSYVVHFSLPQLYTYAADTYTYYSIE